MAGEWIKMRTSLITNPKVNGIARYLEDSSEVSRVLSTGFNGGMSEIVTRNVMRYVTVTSLLVLWGAANEHTDDGVFKNTDISDIDDIVGVPLFGEALESVGWAIFSQDENSVTLPNFSEYNTSGATRSALAKTGAERQKEYRNRVKLRNGDVTSDVTSDVTNDVTRDRREEKRREDIDTHVVSDICECPHREIIALYAKHLPQLPQPRIWEGQRSKNLKARWNWVLSDFKKKGKEATKENGLDYFERMFGYVSKVPFLTGQNGGWSCDLPWLVEAGNFAKVIEGNYENRGGK